MSEYEEHAKCRGCGANLWHLAGPGVTGIMMWEIGHNEANCLADKLGASDENLGLAKAALSELERTIIDLRSRLDAAAKNDEARVAKWATTVARVEEERDAALRRLSSALDRAEKAERSEAAMLTHVQAIEKARTVSMKAGREPDPPKGCTVADPQAYSDDKSRQPSPFVVERQPTIVEGFKALGDGLTSEQYDRLDDVIKQRSE